MQEMLLIAARLYTSLHSFRCFLVDKCRQTILVSIFKVTIVNSGGSSRMEAHYYNCMNSVVEFHYGDFCLNH